MKNPLARLIVGLAYRIDKSRRYHLVKNFFYNLLENDSYRYKKYFDVFMIAVIISSVLILIIDVKNSVHNWWDIYDLYLVTTIFIVEYLLRLWVYSDIHKTAIDQYENAAFLHHPFSPGLFFKTVLAKKWEYMTSFAAVIDLVAILPSYREVRILRVFILFRVFKMLRYTKSVSQFAEILKTKRIEILTLLTLLIFFVFIAGIMLYVFEGYHTNEKVESLFDALYWALVTISTVGYGDITPVTHEGKIVSMVIIVTGMGMFSLLTSIIVTGFGEKLQEISENRIMEESVRKKELVLLCGFGKMSALVAKKLKKSRFETLFIEHDPAQVEKARHEGFRVVTEDATHSDVFLQFDLNARVRSILCLSHDDVQNALITINIRSLNREVQVIARCSDTGIAKKLKLAGANHVIFPEQIAGLMGSVYIGQPVAFEALQAILSQKRNAMIDEIEIKPHAALAGKTIGDIDFKRHRVILFGVIKHVPQNPKIRYYIFNPSGEIVLEARDCLVVMGYSISVDDFKARIEERAYIQR